MTKLPDTINSTAAMIDKAYEDEQKHGNRAHLGCSLLGHKCDRYLWLSFRCAFSEKFSGRMLRLFKRGQDEEAVVVANLRKIGCDVRSTGANQSWVTFGWNVSGSIDGIIEKGLPEAPSKRHILEVKTHSDKSFNELKKGVQEAKPMHYAQMQLYMKGTGIDRALYLAVNKNTDEIYTERVRYDADLADKLVERAHRIVKSDRMPEPCSTDSTWYQCRYCPGHDMCFGSKMTKEVNCRTCAFSTVTENGFKCERYSADIPVEHQRTGCDCHVLHPDLVPFKMLEPLDQWTARYEIDGKAVANGDPCATVFSSKEIVANPKACANQDDLVQEMRVTMGARIDG